MEVTDRRSRWWGPGSICFLVIWLALLFFGREQLFRDPGTLWHTRIGDGILDSRALPTQDTFSFTFQGQPWIAQQWLAECLMAAAHRIGGLDALLLFAATVLAAGYAFIFARLRIAGTRPPIATITIALVVAASSYHFHPRPHLASIAGMTAVYALLIAVEAGRCRARSLLLLLPIFIIWTNLHGGALGGIASAVIVLGCWILMLLVAGHASPDGRQLRRVAGLQVLLALACIATVVASPYGLDLPRVWLSLMKSGVVAKIMSEHGPLEWTSIEAMMILLLAAAYLAVLATTWRRILRVTWLLPLLWLALTISRVRHGPLFAVLAGLAIAEMLPHSSLAAALIEPRTRERSIPCHSRIAPIACAAFCLVLAFQSLGVRIPLIGAGWARLNPNYWPIAAAPALQKAIQSAGDPRVFNQMTFGGYLIYAVPDAKVFIDDRCELYGDAFLLQYESLMTRPEEFDAVASQWNLNQALISSRSKLAAYLADHAGWRKSFADDTASLFLRNNASN